MSAQGGPNHGRDSGAVPPKHGRDCGPAEGAAALASPTGVGGGAAVVVGVFSAVSAVSANVAVVLAVVIVVVGAGVGAEVLVVVDSACAR